MGLDAPLREQLIEARKAIVAQIDELIDLERFSYKRRPPDCRDVYAELQDQLREIDELLGTSRNEGEGISETP